MLKKKTQLREAVRELIESFPRGKKFACGDLYRYLEQNYPRECSERGDAANEPRYRHDARAAVWDLMPSGLGLIKRTGVPGERERL